MKTRITNADINRLAIPALISGIAEPLLSITDTAVVGNVSINATEALSAVGIAGAFISMLVWVFGQTRSAISALVSQYLGANKLEQIKTLPAQAIGIILTISIVLIVITYPFAEYILNFYNAEGIILDYSSSYYRIRIFGLPFTLLTFAIFGVFRGLQNTMIPMIIAIFGALLNVVLDFALVYGIEGYIPAMHVDGAAYASLISQICMALLAVIYMIKKTQIPLKIRLPLHKELPKLSVMILNLIIRTIALNVALYFGTSFAAAYGPKYSAAYTILLNLWFFGAFFIDGYSSAGNILAGKLFGEENYEELVKLSVRLTKYAVVVGLLMLVIGGILYYPIGRIFTKEQAVLEEFYAVFILILAMQPLCALAFIFDGIYKGLGKMATLRNVLLIATFVVFIPTIFILDALDLKLYAVWIAFTLWMLARGFPLIIIFRREFIPKISKK
ncbi:MATE family efflux transporter [Kordia sp. YSTF-M3]|uniref:Multidrug-efflux transporter n=1 Tax=Kordia aestuariivivens TaxID=2759037 RepID=A0ABR7QFF0_9FLAO|nr:MATE family efflux transporter [Kordia aestuariivivens]MBC8757024.1 MATE family efflux transporter [Kordia aestuariivivens]